MKIYLKKIKKVVGEKMDNIIKTRIQCKRDTADNWSTNNFTLLTGEIGYETDSNRIKIGDGLKKWNELNYLNTSCPAVKTVIDDVITVNTIYDLGEQTNLSIVLPAGKLGDFIEVDFLSGDVLTSLTITSSSGMSECDLTPEANTIYSLYFNWIRLDADSYGWGVGYAEYTRVVE